MRLTGTSIFLPENVRGMLRTATMASGTWRGERFVRRLAVISPSQVIVQLRVGRQDHEEEQIARAIFVVEVDHEAVGDLWQLLHDAVELGRAQSHATSVQGGVAAPADEA